MMVSILSILLIISLLAILWTYMGYQLFLIPLSKIVRKKHYFDDAFTPLITLLIIVHNEEKVIKRKIENSLNLVYPKDKLEIIVVDDGSTDKTRDIVKEHESVGVKLVEQNPRKGKASAINLGTEHANGEIIIITDGNSLLNEEALKKIVRHFSDPLVGGVGGRYEPKNIEGKDVGLGSIMYWKLERFVREKESAIDSIIGMNGNIAAIRKGIMHKIDENLLVEDFDMTVSLRKEGFRVLYEPEAYAWKLAPGSLKDEIIQKKRRIIGTIQTLSRHKSVLFNPKYGLYGTLIFPSHKLFQMLLPFLFILLVISSFGSYLTTDSILILIFFYLLITFLVSSSISILILHFKPNTKFLPFILLKYFFIQYYEVLVGWLDYLKGNYQVTWVKAESTRDIKEV